MEIINFLSQLWSKTFLFQISFLYVSRLSFLTGSSKGKEGFVKKRHGDFRAGGGCRSELSAVVWLLYYVELTKNVSSWRLCWRWPLTCCDQLPTQWGRRWLVVQDTTLLYLNPETGRAFNNNIAYQRRNGGLNQSTIFSIYILIWCRYSTWFSEEYFVPLYPRGDLFIFSISDLTRRLWVSKCIESVNGTPWLTIYQWLLCRKSPYNLYT